MKRKTLENLLPKETKKQPGKAYRLIERKPLLCAAYVKLTQWAYKMPNL